jgi:hypothetical protein
MSNPVVTFDYSGWLAEYPEFGYVTAPQAQGYFNQATLYVDNTPSSQITDQSQLTLLLNMATAHIAELFAIKNGQSPRGVVGRINSASQGSVSVQSVYTTPTSDLQAWFDQTSYGAAVWAATTRYRTGFYVPPPCDANANPRFGFLRR